MREYTALDAFEDAIRELCLPGEPYKRLNKGKATSPAQRSTIEEIEGAPFEGDLSWSPQAKELRDLVVKSPWVANRDFIRRYFSILHLRDRAVSVHITSLYSLCRSLL